MSAAPLSSQAAAVQAPESDTSASVAQHPPWRSDGRADRTMRRLLGIREISLRSGAGAHRAFRIAVVISGLRCLLTYLVIPVLIPILSLGGWIAGPVGLLLCAIAAVNGVISVRRFWRTDHAHRWTYTAFIAVVFVILAISTWTEATRLAAQL